MVTADYDTKLDSWRNGQNPKIFTRLRPRKVSTPPLHISAVSVRRFVPRIPKSIAPGEDQTVPRVCCSLSLAKCFQGARWNYDELPGPSCFNVYGFDVRNVIDPTVTLTKEPTRNGEVWVVPYQLAYWELTPQLLGQLRLLKYTSDNKRFTYVLFAHQELVFDDSCTVDRGYWLVEATLDGKTNVDLKLIEPSDAKTFGSASNA